MGPIGRGTTSRPPFPCSWSFSPRSCDGGPLCPRGLYARRDTRILLRNCPRAILARVYSCRPSCYFFLFSTVLLSFCLRRVAPFRSCPAARRSMASDAAGCVYIVSLSVSRERRSSTRDLAPCESSARVSARMKKRATHVLPANVYAGTIDTLRHLSKSALIQWIIYILQKVIFWYRNNFFSSLWIIYSWLTRNIHTLHASFNNNLFKRYKKLFIFLLFFSSAKESFIRARKYD